LAALITAVNGRKMPKSSYPNKIDSSIELPIVRNNVTEINADYLNSLRDAIIQIEKTLGINPNGLSTVSERVSSSLDLSGEIKKEALDKAGVIYGPIVNESISKVAAIEESKIKLDFPTKLLQTEISLLKNELDKFVELIEEISSKLSSHLNIYSKARHNSDNIYVPTIDIVPSDVATKGFESGSLSDVLLDIYNGHIGFAGNVSQANNAHNASQIYFDNTNVADLISTTNVQNAIETLADQKTDALKTNLFSTNSNGIIRQSKYSDVINNVDGKLKLDYTDVSYTAVSSQTQTILLSSPKDVLYDIEKFDILEITSGINEEDDKKYLILDFELISGQLSSVTILNGTKNNSGVNSQIRIFKNPYQYSNLNAYNTTVRPRYNRTNTPDIIIAHPNAATILTKNLVTEKISTTAANLGLEVDGSSYNIPVYNPARGTTNTLDEIILNINEYCVDNKIPVFAFKYKDVSCYEIAISHVLPSWIDSTTNRYLKIIPATSNDAMISFGVDHLLDEEVYGSYGNAVLINGNTVLDNDSFITYLGSDLELIAGTNNITFETIEPISEGIKVGNLCYVEDNGLYRIQIISGNTITLDDQGSTFTADIAANKRVFIYKGTVSLEELEFSEIVSSNGSIMLDIFMTENFDYGYHIRATIEGVLQSASFQGIIYDISKGYLINQTDIISISTSGLATVFDGASTSSGDQLYSSGEYIIRSPSGSNFYKMQTLNGPPLGSSLSVTVSGFNELPFNLIHLSRCIYSTSFGFILGDSDIGVPAVVDKRPSGTVNEVIISPSLLEKYISGPTSELRSDGAISGLNFSTYDTTATKCLLSINPGFYYNSGIRYKFNGVLDMPVTHGGVSFFVGFDKNGCLKIGTEIIDPVGGGSISPFYAERITYIAYMIVDISGSITSIDLRKSISFIDKKIQQIIVAQESGAGHFTSIKEAVNYAKYYKMFNLSSSIPSVLIKNGIYEIDETIILDFDIEISGSGPGTILKQGDNLVSSSGLNEGLLVEHYSSAMFLIGTEDSLSANQSSDFIYGVKISNLTCKHAESYSSAINSNFNFFFLILQGLASIDDVKTFKFDNVIFDGASSMLESSSVTVGSLDATRQFIPIAIGLASDSGGTAPTIFGGIITSNCTFKYMGSGWATIGAIISKAGSYTISNCNIHGNLIKKASPNSMTVSGGDYLIFNNSINYSMSGFNYPTMSSISLSMSNICVAANTLSD